MNPLCLLLVALCSIVACGCQSQSSKPPRLRILTYNIHHGEGLDKRLDLGRIARVITESNADLVALQEIDKGMKRTNGVDQAAELGRLTGYHAVFARATDYDGGEYGQAILSRWPVNGPVVHRLPFDTAEPRIGVEVRVTPNDRIGEIRFVGTHLEHRLDELRLRQVKQMVSSIPKDAIVAGDFNAVPESEVMAEMLEHWSDTSGDAALTIFADRPTKKIDWVLTPKGGRWRVVSARVIEEAVASDHRPVVVELELVSAEPVPK